MTRKRQWSTTVGERGYRVTLEQRYPTMLYLRYWDPGRKNYRRVRLRHNDRELGLEQAKKLAAQLLTTGTAPARNTLPVADLFARYEHDVTRFKKGEQPAEDRRRMELWQTFLGSDHNLRTLDFATMNRFTQERRAGLITLPPAKRLAEKPGKPRLGLPVSDTTIGADLAFLRAVLNWATTVTLADGSRLLEHNPIAGYSIPKNKRPRRPLATYDRYLKLKAVAEQVDPRFGAFLDLVEALGWRVSALGQLRGEDVDRKARPGAPHGRVLKRGAVDKEGVEMWVPLSSAARAALDRLPVLGGWLFSLPRKIDKPWTRWWATKLLRRAEQLAELEHLEHGAWHPFRRKWATERKHLPLQDVMAAGGWDDPRALQTIYQQVDDETLFAVVSEPRKLREAK